MPNTSGFKQDVIGSYIDKDPHAQLTYTVDWSDWLPASTTLSTGTFTASTIANDANPLSIGATAIIDQNKSTVIISGGTAGEIYTVTNSITTNNGDVDRRRFRIRVVERHI